MKDTPQNAPALRAPRGKLTRLWRNLLVSTALATSLAACSTNPRPNTQPLPHDGGTATTQQDTAPPPQSAEEAFRGEILIITEPLVISPGTMAEALEEERRDNIRIVLLQRAQRDFARLAALARTSYSTQLDSLETALNSYIVARDTTVHNRAAVLDPVQFDVGLALGFSPQQTVALMLTLERVRPTPDRVLSATRKMGMPVDTRLGIMSYTQAPTALANFAGHETDICIIIPSSDHALAADIPGLSHTEQIKFINRHEAWHCKDSDFNLRHMTQEELDRITPGRLVENVDNWPMLEIFSISYKKEALADVGAAGDMVRKDGYGPEIIDSISGWRQNHPDDLEHLSSPVLAELKRRIAVMGLPAFRAMNDNDAHALYVEITREKGMSARSLAFNIRFELADKEGKEALLEQAKTDPEAAKAVEFLTYYHQKPVNNQSTGELTADERARIEAVMQWNPFAQLEDRAFALARKITPASLAQAYGLLQDELRGEIAANPGNTLPAAKMMALKDTFIWQVQSTDYVEANALRGVDITKAERGLSQFAAQKHNDAPRSP